MRRLRVKTIKKILESRREEETSQQARQFTE